MGGIVHDSSVRFSLGKGRVFSPKHPNLLLATQLGLLWMIIMNLYRMRLRKRREPWLAFRIDREIDIPGYSVWGLTQCECAFPATKAETGTQRD